MNRIKPEEIRAALILLIAAAAVFYFIEDKVIDPWGVFNPRRFALLILSLGALQFAGYAATKFLGRRTGAILLGLLGGFVSSTAVVLAAARESRDGKTAASSALMSVIASQISSLIQLLFIAALVSRELFLKLSLPMGAAILTAIAVLLFFSGKNEDSSSDIGLRSPLDWHAALRLAAVFAFMLTAVAVAKNVLGDAGSTTISVLAGLFEVHAITLANSTMFDEGKISLALAALNIALAVSASLGAKAAICLMFARNSFTYFVTAAHVLLVSVVWTVNFLLCAFGSWGCS